MGPKGEGGQGLYKQFFPLWKLKSFAHREIQINGNLTTGLWPRGICVNVRCSLTKWFRVPVPTGTKVSIKFSLGRCVSLFWKKHDFFP